MLCGILNLGSNVLPYYPLAKPVCFLAVPEEVTRSLYIVVPAYACAYEATCSLLPVSIFYLRH